MQKPWHKKKFGFKSIVENIDTTSPTGTFFFQVTGAFAELERNIIKERTKAGVSVTMELERGFLT